MVHGMKIRFGEFRTEVDVPWPVYPEDVEASYVDGFLRVRLSRPRSRRVAIAKPGED